MAYTVRISFMNVNQGMAGVIELYTGLTGALPAPPVPGTAPALVNPLPPGAVLAGIILVDFGCQGSTGMANDVSVQYVRDLMTLRGANVIDLASISHLDDDHYSLLRHLGSGTTISNVLIGGEDVMRNNIGTLNAQLIAGNVAVTNVFFYFGGHTAAGPNPYLNPDIVFQVGANEFVGVAVLLSSAQHFYTPPPTRAAEYINTGSTMLLVYSVSVNGSNIAVESSFLFTGDATTKTLGVFNNLPFINNFAGEPKGMSVPHHGSDSSIRSRGGDYADLAALLTAYPPEVAAVSAGYNRGYKHPGKYSMYYFREAVNNPGAPLLVPAPRVLPDSVPPPAVSTHVNSTYYGSGSRARVRGAAGSAYTNILNTGFYAVEEIADLYNTSTAWGTPFARRNIHIDFDSVNQGAFTVTRNEF